MPIKKEINGRKEYIYESVEEWLTDIPPTNTPDIKNNWRKGNKGDWVLTDDEQVCKILKKGNMRTNNRNITKVYIRTILGTYLVEGTAKMEGKPPKNIYAFARGKNHYDQRIKSGKEATQKEFMFAKYIANGLHPTDAYIRAFPTNNRKYADHTSKALMRTERISTLITDEMRANLKKVDVDEEYLLLRTKFIIEKEESRDSDKLRAIETLMKISGMFPDSKRTESLTVFQGFTQKELEALKGEDVKILAHAEKAIEE